MNAIRQTPLPLLALLGLLLGGCTLVSEGARSAIVVLIRDEVTTPGSKPLPKPSRDEIKALLSQHFLWLADDKRAAQWIAYIEVRTPANLLMPFGLTLREVKKNPAWRPLEVSDPPPGWSNKYHTKPESFRLTEANESSEQMRTSTTN